MNPLADLWVACRCWYWERVVAAIERAGGHCHTDYKWARQRLSAIRREMRHRGLV